MTHKKGMYGGETQGRSVTYVNNVEVGKKSIRRQVLDGKTRGGTLGKWGEKKKKKGLRSE